MKLSIKGDSMRPFINDGDVLEVEVFSRPRELLDFDVGRVFLIKDQEEWIIHRAVRINQTIKTKGDWSSVFDAKNIVWGQALSLEGNDGKFNFLESKFLAKISCIDYYLPHQVKKTILTLLKRCHPTSGSKAASFKVIA